MAIAKTIAFINLLCTPNASRITSEIPTVKPTHNPVNNAE